MNKLRAWANTLDPILFVAIVSGLGVLVSGAVLIDKLKAVWLFAFLLYSFGFYFGQWVGARNVKRLMSKGNG